MLVMSVDLATKDFVPGIGSHMSSYPGTPSEKESSEPDSKAASDKTGVPFIVREPNFKTSDIYSPPLPIYYAAKGDRISGNESESIVVFNK